jgi:hypothetical protein
MELGRSSIFRSLIRSIFFWQQAISVGVHGDLGADKNAACISAASKSSCMWRAWPSIALSVIPLAPTSEVPCPPDRPKPFRRTTTGLLGDRRCE